MGCSWPDSGVSACFQISTTVCTFVDQLTACKNCASLWWGNQLPGAFAIALSTRCHLPADAQWRGPQPTAAAGKGGDASRQSLESLRSENEALRSSISEAEAAVGHLSNSGGGATAAGDPDSPEAVLDAADNGAAANGNKTSAGTAPPSAEPSAEHPAGMPSTSNEHAGGLAFSSICCSKGLPRDQPSWQ